MSFTCNRVILIGRAAASPEVRLTDGGQRVATCSIATDRPTRAGSTPTTDWHRVVCFDKLAEIAAEHLTKGRLVFVEGAITYRTWQDQQGSKHITTNILARELILLDRPPVSANQASANRTQDARRAGPDGDRL
jgi:single-strand DNA-binding protein